MRQAASLTRLAAALALAAAMLAGTAGPAPAQGGGGNEVGPAAVGRSGLPIPGTATLIGFECADCEKTWPAE